MVRTVLGDVDPSSLGVTYLHEHLIIDSELVAEHWPHIMLPDTASAINEVRGCVEAGVGTMVDAMPMASGRGPARLAEISLATGLNIVMATGLHTEKYYARLPWVNDASVEQLVDWFVADIEVGARADDHLSGKTQRTSHRAGVIKVATDHSGMNRRAERLFTAAAIAAAQTGVPILTHAEEGRGAMAQLEYLRDLKVPMGRVVVSHTDKVADPGYHASLLETGANLEFDQALRQHHDAGSGTARLLLQHIEAGYGDQLMLGTDGARRSLWASHGGAPGLAWMAAGYRRTLSSAGIDEAMQHRLFVDNPGRFLASANQSQDKPISAEPEKERI